jgi:3-methyladenine DNA glycosylase AlkD
MSVSFSEMLGRLKGLASPENVAGMARFGINPERTLGVSMPALRRMAKEIGKDHALARQLWSSGIHEARILACLVDDPEKVTEKQMDRWVRDFDSWDVCDQCCLNLFDRTPWAYDKALEWSARSEEFVKRAGFALMAVLAVHDKKATDGQFEKFFPVIGREATDERNFVRKSVNWALRQIGKRNRRLNKLAVQTARDLSRLDSKNARWIGSDAVRELTGEKVQKKWDRK